MKPIINDQEIVSIYNTADPATKIALQRAFGKEPFAIDFAEKIKSFEDGLTFKGISSDAVLSSVPSQMIEHEKRIHAFSKLVFLADIYRDGWTADYSDPDQRKYYPWFEYSGSGLSVFGVVCDRSLARVASRLTFPTENMARAFGKNFTSIYNEFLL